MLMSSNRVINRLLYLKEAGRALCLRVHSLRPACGPKPWLRVEALSDVLAPAESQLWLSAFLLIHTDDCIGARIRGAVLNLTGSPFIEAGVCPSPVIRVRERCELRAWMTECGCPNAQQRIETCDASPLLIHPSIRLSQRMGRGAAPGEKAPADAAASFDTPGGEGSGAGATACATSHWLPPMSPEEPSGDPKKLRRLSGGPAMPSTRVQEERKRQKLRSDAMEAVVSAVASGRGVNRAAAELHALEAAAADRDAGAAASPSGGGEVKQRRVQQTLLARLQAVVEARAMAGGAGSPALAAVTAPELGKSFRRGKGRPKTIARKGQPPAAQQAR